MTIQIDARLHLENPQITLRNCQNGKILMRWGSSKIQQWLKNGDISYKDLNNPGFSWQELMQSTR